VSQQKHPVPLSEQAVELLLTLTTEGNLVSGFVFPARNRTGHLGKSAMLDLLRRMGWKDQTTTHGIRAAFKTWATERTNYTREVVELCLSHVQGDPLERAYQRGDILEKRRRLMQDWADYCTSGTEVAGVRNVVSLRS
jgi:integrase